VPVRNLPTMLLPGKIEATMWTAGSKQCTRLEMLYFARSRLSAPAYSASTFRNSTQTSSSAGPMDHNPYHTEHISTDTRKAAKRLTPLAQRPPRPDLCQFSLDIALTHRHRKSILIQLSENPAGPSITSTTVLLILTRSGCPSSDRSLAPGSSTMPFCFLQSRPRRRP